MPDGNGGERLGFGVVPCDAPGIDIKDTWDVLGMRGSGSHDTVFTDYFVPEGGLTDVGGWGEWGGPVLTFCATQHGLVGAMLGIAEATRDYIVAMLKTRRKAPSNRALAERPGIQHLVAEIEIDLAAARAMLARRATAVDAFLEKYGPGSEPLDEFHLLHKDFQCAKYIITRNAIAIVDRALTLSGGSGYLSASPLARLYRDVRAGPFMQPYSPNEVHEYIGKVALGLDPTLEV